MALYLARHGKNLPKEVDSEKGLSEQGIKEVAGIAASAGDSGIAVSIIRHSGKKRARQTAEILFAALKPAGGIHETGGIAPLDDVAGFGASADPAKNEMIVGHLPFMEKLVAYLITGDSEKSVIDFQPGGIVCLDKDSDDWGWVIKWALMPTIG
jgi:phosphohistidine phosphatase